jgi:hypothetical protein
MGLSAFQIDIEIEPSNFFNAEVAERQKERKFFKVRFPRIPRFPRNFFYFAQRRKERRE